MWCLAVVAATLVLGADQASKACALAGPRSAVLSRAGAMGLRVPVVVLALVWVAVAVVLAAALQAGVFGAGPLGPLAVGAALGGAAGNLVDRFRRGAVVDFIELRPLRRFNLADAAITCGGGALVLLAFR